ncbi:unnamed protein product [Rotaria sp. Silwood1]|nr:unnamed protein product [Rotaria sp. Silwood1]
MISSDDSNSGNDSGSKNSFLTSSSSSFDNDDKIDVTKWTVTPTVNRDPFQFVDNRETLVNDAQTPIEFWNYIFPENLVEFIVSETNRYAENICNNSNSRQQYSRITKWESTNIEEFNVVIVLLILQGMIKKPDIQMYFTTDELLATPIFNKIINANGFQILLKILHFETDVDPDTTLKKIWPVIEALRSSFRRLYKPGRF